jgi:hypothetical protein
VKIDRDVELMSGFPERPILPLVQIMAVRLTVHHRSAKSELGHAALKFHDGGPGVLKWESGKAREAVGMFLDTFGKNIVHAACHLDRSRGVWIELNAAVVEAG